MKGPRLCEISDRLEELIEEHLTQIEVKIRRDYYLIDIAEEVADLNDLLASYKRRVELLEQLLDCSTPEARRHQIRQALEAQGLRVATDPAELARLYRKSHALLARSVQLVLKIQCRVDKEAFKHTGYALELCGFCGGLPRGAENPCPACHSKRIVLVIQPSTKCSGCGGDGRPKNNLFLSKLCVVCNGTGWVMTQHNDGAPVPVHHTGISPHSSTR
jgi:hypothetical protein